MQQKKDRIRKWAVRGAVAIMVARSLSVNAAETAYWTWGLKTGGTSMVDALDLCADENWDTGRVAGTDQPVQFRQSETSKTLSDFRFAKIVEPSTFFQLIGDSFVYPVAAKTTVVVSDVPVTFVSGSPFRYLWLYGDFHCSSYLDNSFLAGDYLDKERDYTYNSGVLHRLDYYAKAPGGVRINPASTNGYITGWNSGGIYAPYSSSVAISGSWSTRVADSPYLFPETSGLHLPVGTQVTDADGILPSGTFLKRIFPDGSIELSSKFPSVGTYTLTFAPMNVDVYQQVAFMTCGSGGWIKLMKHAIEDELVFDVGRLGTYNSSHVENFDCDSDCLPGTFRVHDATSASLNIVLTKCHVEFAETKAEGGSGFPNAPVWMPTASSTARLTVQSDVSASINAFTNLVGVVTKDGAGTLKIGLSGTNKSANRGTILIENGVVELSDESYVASVRIAAGGVLKLDGNVEVDTLDCAVGAKIDGKGLLTVASCSPVAGVTFGPGVSVRFVGGTGTVRDTQISASAATIVETAPAFWVDVKTSPMVTVTDPSGVKRVSRIDDVRKKSDGDDYMFAAAANADLLPEIVVNTDDEAHHLYFPFRQATAIDGTYDLKWSRGLSTIRAVFEVQCFDGDAGGGQVLGITDAFAALQPSGQSDPFLRAQGLSFSGAIVYGDNVTPGSAREAVLNGRWYQNGERSSTSACFGMYANKGLDGCWAPLTLDIHIDRAVAADCFTYQPGDDGRRNGRKRLCELIVYDRELSEDERLSIEQYLMSKWQNCDVSFNRCDDRRFSKLDVSMSPNLSPADGETVYLDSPSGTGTLMKSGKGMMVIDNLDSSVTDLHIADGKVRVYSRSSSDVSLIPEGAYLHVDATRPDLMAFDGNDGINVTEWRSVNDDGVKLTKWMSSVYPQLTANAIHGDMPALDFGEASSSGNGGTRLNIPHFLFSEVSHQVRTLIMVQNTSKSGGSISSAWNSWATTGMFRGGWSSTYDKDPPITYATPILGDGQSKNYSYGCDNGSLSRRMNLNGKMIDPFVQGFTGGDDLLTFVGYRPFYAQTLSLDTGVGQAGGGQILGEYLLYTRGLSKNAIADVEAYLRKKWFKAETPGYVPAVAGDVVVEGGAVLEVYGGSALTVSSLGGAGVVQGTVAFASEPSFTVRLEEGSSVPSLTLPADINLGTGGFVVLSGGGWDSLPAGDYTIATSAAFKMGMTGWTLVNAPVKRVCSVVVEDGKLVLRCLRRGLCVIVR